MREHIYPRRLMPSKIHQKMEMDDYFDDFYLVNYTKEDLPYDDIEQMRQDIETQMEGKRFKSGCSVTLAVVFFEGHHQKRVIKNVAKDYFGEWSEGEEGVRPLNEDVNEISDRGWFGIRKKDIETVEANYDFKSESLVSRKDKIFFRVIHRPTKSNFWHCHIEVLGIKNGNGDCFQANIKKESGYSNRQLEQAAIRLVDLMKPYLVHQEDIEPRFISYKRYMRGSLSKKEYKRFKKE